MIPATEPLPGEAIARGFEELIAERRLFGAELSPSIKKKDGSGAGFLVSGTPPMRKLLSRWSALFGNRVAPDALFRLLSVDLLGFAQRENSLLFGKDRIIYDAEIFHGDEPSGGLTLFLYTEFAWDRGLLASLLSREKPRIVYIEQVHLKDQASGYASALFRYYEKLFHDLGFNQFRLKASLSVGKYYWAKEGFDFRHRSDLVRMREELRSFVRERELPVRETELVRLNHAYDFALFRRDLSVPVYRDDTGYYSTVRDDKFRDELRFPLGKAFLLCSKPWDGYKVIYTNTPRRTGFVYSKRYLDHRTRGGHLENGGRLTRLMKAVRKEGLEDSLVFLEPYPPEMESVEAIHKPEFVESFRRSVLGGDRHFSTTDCSICMESFDVAMLAAGGVMAGVDAVMNRRVENVFCAVRPPGHHASAGAAMGFCFVNNLAVGAAYARSVYGVKKIFLIDWDAHHGNGTQDIFEDDPGTYFCSIHEHPTYCFPGTGRRMERGKGAGAGYTLNIPLRPHAGDAELVEAFEGEVVPEIDRFRPDLIMISAGFDAHRDDPIANLELSEASYVHMTSRICELAEKHCEGRIVSVLEGGYNGASLASSVTAHLKALQGRSGK